MNKTAFRKIIAAVLCIASLAAMLGMSGCSIPSFENIGKISGNSESESKYLPLPQNDEEGSAENSAQPQKHLNIRFINCGQGDAALVECDGHYMVIDGGDKSNSQRMYSILQRSGITHLDLLVATHVHSDHMGGLPGVLKYASADTVLCNVDRYDSDDFSDFKKYVEASGKEITVPDAGSKYSLGGAKISVLSLNAGESENDNSIMLKLTYGGISVLFAGDAGEKAEIALLKSGADVSADVIKIGHHGSKSSTTELLLSAVSPAHAIISVGKGNKYGHPDDVVINRLKDNDISIWRTDLSGDIILESNGEEITIISEKEPGKAKESAQETVAEESVSASSVPVVDPGESIQQPEKSKQNSEGSDAPQEGEKQNPEESISSGTQEESKSGGAEVPDCDYVVNTNSGKFHYPNCVSVGKMKESNKMYYTGSRDELTAKGYEPCNNCNP